MCDNQITAKCLYKEIQISWRKEFQLESRCKRERETDKWGIRKHLPSSAKKQKQKLSEMHSKCALIEYFVGILN